MKIVVLDGYTLNPGDLTWQPLEEIAETIVYDRTPPELVVERTKDASIILTNKAYVSSDAISKLPNLTYVGVMATGYNSVDILAAKKQNIPVTNVPAYSTPSVAQHTFALLFSLTNRVETYATSVAKGDWVNAPDWTYQLTPLNELAGQKLGVVGLGQIGLSVAQIGRALGMEILGNRADMSKPTEDYIQLVELETLFKQSDAISLHSPLTATNNAFVNASLLKQMKPHALLINTARGGLINEQDLADALNNNIIAGAGLDVLSTEPPSPNNPLLTAKNCLITPHLSWGSYLSRKRLLHALAKNIRAFLQGNPINVVNG